MAYVAPSASLGLARRREMDAALVSSVRIVLGEGQGPDGPAAAAASGPLHQTTADRAGMLDYGAYFDLVLDIAGDGEGVLRIRRQAADYLRNRLPLLEGAEIEPASPQVTTLSPEFYSGEDIARLIRWWDTEPEIMMALTGASGDQLDLARRNIGLALDYLRQCNPELFAEFQAIVAEIVVACSGPGALTQFTGGVTSFALWGSVAVDAASNDSWVRMYRSLVHEAGHNLLFAIAREEPLVANDPGERFVSPLRTDLRPMDGVFHGAYVLVRESLALDSLLCWHEESGRLALEEAALVHQLLGASVEAFWDCDAILLEQARLTPLGDAILTECESYMNANFALEPA